MNYILQISLFLMKMLQTILQVYFPKRVIKLNILNLPNILVIHVKSCTFSTLMIIYVNILKFNNYFLNY